MGIVKLEICGWEKKYAKDRMGAVGGEETCRVYDARRATGVRAV